MKQKHLFCMSGRMKFTSQMSAFLLAFLLLFSPLMPVFAGEISNPSISLPSISDTKSDVSVDEKPIIAPDPIDIGPLPPTIEPPSIEPPKTEPSSVQPPVTEPPTIEPPVEEPPKEEPPIEPSSSQPFYPENLTAGLTEKKKGVLETDETSGALNYSFPVEVPLGRNGLQPNIQLNYNNQQANNYPNLIGYGWNIGIPYIDRLNKTGTDKLYTDNYFNSSLSGELILVSGTTYIPKVENGEFLKYTYSGNSWVVTDKKGTTYKFGQNTSGRQDDTTGTKIYKWMLEEIRDTNNNYIKYEYFKDAGQIYPSKIKYTGNGSTDGIFEVEFLRESRIDINKSYVTTFLVTTNYRISEIQTKINNVWIKKYVMGYTVGDAGVRSLLASIIESGQDQNSVVTTLPAISFDYYKSIPGWTVDTTTYTSPIYLSGGFQSLLDVNGDALPDIVESYNTLEDPRKHIYLNNTQNTWVLDNNLQLPILFLQNEIRGGSHSDEWDQGVRVGDVNGDLLPDIIKAEEDTMGRGGYDAYLNTNGFSWAQNNSWIPTVTINSDDNISSWGSHFIDFNADGLNDIIKNQNGAAAQINIGTGFSASTQSWNTPVILSGPFSQFTDVNNDNLPDIIYIIWINYNTTCIREVYLNKGDGTWLLDNSFFPPVDPVFATTVIGAGVRFFDVNNDGLVDLFTHHASLGGGGYGTYLNIGTGEWIYAPEWNSPESVDFTYDPTNIADINADGSLDFLLTTGNPMVTKAIVNKTTTPVDILKKITFPEGGNTTINYKKSSKYYDGSNNLSNPNLPIAIDTVYQTITTDSNGISTSTYSYKGGSYYFNTATDRKFSGFNKVVKLDSAGNQTTTYFHQGNTSDSSNGEYNDDAWKIGKPYKIETADSSGNIYSKTINKWDDVDLGSGSKFVKLTQTVNYTYNNDGIHKDKVESYTYNDTNGNVTQKTEYGEVVGGDDGSFVDSGSDKFTTSYTYASGTNISLLSSLSTVDQSSNKVKESKYYYDNLSLGSVSKGNLTKQENWKSGSTYVNTQKSYNTYGLVTSSANELGKVTNYSYDPYNLYPATVTDPLSHTTQYLYDYGAGKPKQITDQNGAVYQNIFDGLGRIIQEKIPDFISPSTSVLKTSYEYTDTANAVSVHKADYLDASNTIDTYIYFDGLGRKIQERKEAETGYSVKDYVYNSRGLLDKESLLYNSTGSAKTTPTSIGTLYTTYNYDPIERVTVSTNAVGSTLYSYNDWKTTITDANSKQKSYYKDAYGNLIKVDEVNAGTTYTTSYSYNGNNKLTNITDALGNLRNFTYDGLGRRLTAQDLHASGDVTFGSWSYAYDDAGNMTQSVSGEAKTINYSYDNINRLQSEDYTGDAGVEISYVYDNCTKGIGKLCSSTVVGGGDNVYTYDSLGNVASDQATVDGNSYLTSYSYDRQNNPSTLTYPDNAQVKYTYNVAGLLEKIERKESTGAFTNVVSNFDYSPMGQVTTQVDANGITTTNTYDSVKLYRLTNKKTINPAPLSSDKNPKPVIILLGPPVTDGGGEKIPPETTQPASLQDLSYTYDNIGNITKIVDASNTATVKTSDYVYDDLYRLTSATITGVPSGQNTYTQNFIYDAVGNITSGPLGAYLYQGNTGTNYANPHAPTSIGGVAQTYDKDGNLTSAGGITYSWNYKGKLAENLSSYNYYNAKGDRVWTNSFSSINSYYPNKFYSTACYNCYDRQPPNQRQTKLIKQIYMGDTSVMTIETLGSTVTPYYNHTDHLNSIIIVSDTNKNIAQTLDYYPYGKERIITPPGDYLSQRQYIGQVHDQITGLDYLNARYYKAERGQFISQDPQFWNFDNSWLLDPQNQNSYSYGRDNPITLSDPSGNSIISNAIQGIKNVWNNLFGNNKVSQTQVNNTIALRTIQTASSKKGNVDYGKYAVTSTLLRNRLEQFANNTNQNIIVTSGDRSSERNKTVGGASTSRHLSGDAVDIKVNGASDEQLSYKANASGLFNPTIYYPVVGLPKALPPHVHVDLNPTHNNTLLIYSPYMSDGAIYNSYESLINPLLKNN